MITWPVTCLFACLLAWLLASHAFAQTPPRTESWAGRYAMDCKPLLPTEADQFIQVLCKQKVAVQIQADEAAGQADTWKVSLSLPGMENQSVRTEADIWRAEAFPDYGYPCLTAPTTMMICKVPVGKNLLEKDVREGRERGAKTPEFQSHSGIILMIRGGLFLDLVKVEDQ